MKNLSNNELLEHIDSKYSLITVISQRARQIYEGSKPLVEQEGDEGPISIAVKELKNGLLSFHRIDRSSLSESDDENLLAREEDSNENTELENIEK